MNNLITLKKITKNFFNNKKISVLKKIDYSFKKGKVYSIMGPSGSGKSTLLNILSMIDKPTSGSLSINNIIINFSKTVDNDKIRSKKIGIIYQQNNLLSDFTALENVYLARLAVDNNKKKSVEASKKIIKQMGLTSRENHYPSELSGGEIQRIAIARAIYRNPEILFMDESTSALDIKTENLILNDIKKNFPKKTIVMIAHRKTSLEKCDEVWTLENGEILLK